MLSSEGERGVGEFQVRDARVEDLEAILAVQHRAFGRVAEQFDLEREGLPPMIETVERLQQLWAQGMRFWVAEDRQGTVVGSVRSVETDGVVEIGRLVVDDGWERQGVASALMDALENGQPRACAFRLFTGAMATGPLRLYEGRGYRISETETVHGIELVWLQKDGRGAVS